MVKLKYLKAYDMDDIPDHLREGVLDTSKKMAALLHELSDCDVNVFLGALNFCHAAFILNALVETDEEIEKGSKLTAITLHKNVKFLWDMKKNGKLN